MIGLTRPPRDAKRAGLCRAPPRRTAKRPNLANKFLAGAALWLLLALPSWAAPSDYIPDPSPSAAQVNEWIKDGDSAELDAEFKKEDAEYSSAVESRKAEYDRAAQMAADQNAAGRCNQRTVVAACELSDIVKGENPTLILAKADADYNKQKSLYFPNIDTLTSWNNSKPVKSPPKTIQSSISSPLPKLENADPTAIRKLPDLPKDPAGLINALGTGSPGSTSAPPRPPPSPPPPPPEAQWGSDKLTLAYPEGAEAPEARWVSDTEIAAPAPPAAAWGSDALVFNMQGPARPPPPVAAAAPPPPPPLPPPPPPPVQQVFVPPPPVFDEEPAPYEPPARPSYDDADMADSPLPYEDADSEVEANADALARINAEENAVLQEDMDLIARSVRPAPAPPAPARPPALQTLDPSILGR